SRSGVRRRFAALLQVALGRVLVSRCTRLSPEVTKAIVALLWLAYRFFSPLQRSPVILTIVRPIIQAFVVGSIAPLVSSYATVVEALTKLQTTLANRSRTCTFGLLFILMNLKQEGSTVVDYLQRIKMIIDDLALIGHFLTDEEVLVHTLNGLSVEFKELAATLQAHDSPISFEELYNKLTYYEAYLKHVDKLSEPLPGPPIRAQFNQKSKTQNRKYNKNTSNV
ncbi:hypothetical protein B296_00052488, partial [Ensete ventricosum]